MRFNEFENDARKQLAENKNLTEEQLDEILPAIGAIGAGVARVAGTAAMRGGAALAKGVGKAAVKGAGALAKGAVKTVGRAASGAARGIGRAAAGAARGVGKAAAASIAGPTNSPNATVGSQSTGGAQMDPAVSKELDKSLKPGKMIDLPSKSAGGKAGPATKFKVTKNARGEVELQNPKQMPGEPKKFVYNKDELAGILNAN